MFKYKRTIKNNRLLLKAAPLKSRRSGQAMVEGVCALVLVTMLAVMMICFMVNLHLMLIFRQQLNYIAEQAATYAANRLIATSAEDTKLFVSGLEIAINLPSSPTDVSVEATKINGVQGSRVTIKNKFGLFGKGYPMPLKIDIQSVAVAANLGYLPLPDVWIGSGDSRGFIPAYNPNTNVAPTFGTAQIATNAGWQ